MSWITRSNNNYYKFMAPLLNMADAVQLGPSVKGRLPELSMLEIVKVANKRYKMSKLRQPIIPQGFCCVCSRLDPSGVFSNPNSHLYNKGYFHACENFPRAPYTTYIQADNNVPCNDRSEFSASQTSTQAEKPAIRVNICQGSSSKINHSPLKTERTSGSSPIKSEALDSSRSEMRLPSIYSMTAHIGQSLSSTNIITKSSQSCVQTGQSNRAWLLKPTEFLNQPEMLSDFLNVSVGNIANSKAFTTPTADRINIISTRTTENDNSIFTLSKGTTHSKKSKTLFSKMTTESVWNVSDQTDNQLLGSRLNIPAVPYINILDGLQSIYALEPLVREVAKLKSTKGSTEKIPNVRRQRESISHLKPSYSPSFSLSNQRPEPGRLRYHHRLVVKSLPKHGFEIPPTPSIETWDMKQNDASEVARVGELENDDTKDASMHFSDNRTSNAKAMSNTPEKSFCRCASVLREISWSRNVCKTCGKSCSHSCDEKTENAVHDSNGMESLSSTRKLLHQNGSREQQNAFTDEDHKDSFIHDDDDDDDDNYCSSKEDDSFQDLDRSPLSLQSNKHAQPYPLIDPDIHKLAYLNAIREAHIRNLKQNKHLEFCEIEKLRRPNVFSYFPLLPYRNESGVAPTNLGIRPDNSVLPKTEQIMRHIFGDVKLDDFYPGRKIRDDKKIVFNDLPKSATSEKMSEKKEFESELFVPSDVKKTTIGLKMRKHGLSAE